MTLQLYQILYERYSTLGLSYVTDRPRAIAGLEKRLMKALNSSGGYGIFQSKDKTNNYFHRGLLWQHDGGKLKRIEFKPEEQVPSWSWMAFEGGIRYMNVPFGDIDPANDIFSPFGGIGPGKSYTDLTSGKLAELQAPIRTLAVPTPARLILDVPEARDRRLVRPLRCVVVGKSQRVTGDGQRTHYALIVSYLRKEEGVEIYERAGVAFLNTAEILPEQDKKYVRIQ
jgi:hypothetical protein